MPMYLSKLTIDNFRRFSHLELLFNEGLNVLVGENDAGKTAILDAIKLLTGTHSGEWSKLEIDDFYTDGKTIASELKIVCLFSNLSDEEAATFLEWLSVEDKKYYLKLTLTAKLKQRVNLSSEIYFDVKAGEDEDSGTISGEARNKLRITYLKALRDAEYQLTPRKGSRLAQILSGYEIFQEKKDHHLVKVMDNANAQVKDYFENKEGKQVSDTINIAYLKEFSLLNNPLSSRFEVSNTQLTRILEKLELLGLSKSENSNLGLGSSNLLFIAAEMLLLKKESGYIGLKLSLIEEIEAHLHPQLQINLIDFINSQSKGLGFQCITTTHSNSISSVVDVENITLCKDGQAFSLRAEETELDASDYNFLKRFLDDTKANLFFANAVILVEGDAENLLLPSLAELIGISLHKYGISIVNVGSTALLRYSKIFQRKDKRLIGVKVSCITDLDIPPKEAREYRFRVKNKNTKVDEERELLSETRKTEDEIGDKEKELIVQSKKEKFDGGDVKTFLPESWTLEFEISRSCLKKLMHKAVQAAIITNDLQKPLDASNLRRIFKKCADDFRSWDGAGKTSNEIAVEIYAPLERKLASKAVCAQIFSLLLRRYVRYISKDSVIKDPYLKYIVDAIKHAANV